MKQLFFDLETTGVSVFKNAIHQISGVVVIDGHLQEQFNIHCRPHEGAEVSDEALAVAGITQEQLFSYPSPMEAYHQLTAILGKYVDKFDKQDKFFLVGYNNVSFDNPFLRRFFELNGDKYFGSWFWSNSIDVMVLASQVLMGQRPQMANFKQGTVAQTLGINIDESKLHDALYDIKVCMMIYQRVMELVRARTGYCKNHNK